MAELHEPIVQAVSQGPDLLSVRVFSYVMVFTWCYD